MLTLTKSCFLTVVLQLFCMVAYAQYSTGGDVSRNCQSSKGFIVCSGKQLESDSNFSPTATFTCDNTRMLILLTHEPLSIDSNLRNVTLQYKDKNNQFKKLTLQSPALSETQSVTFDNNSELYNWIYSFLFDLGDGLEFIIENGGVTKGIFELDDSDVFLISHRGCG